MDRPAHPCRLSLDPDLPDHERQLLGSSEPAPSTLGSLTRGLMAVGSSMVLTTLALLAFGDPNNPVVTMALGVAATALGAGAAWRSHRRSARTRYQNLRQSRRDRGVNPCDLGREGKELLVRAQRATDAVREAGTAQSENTEAVVVMNDIEWRVARALHGAGSPTPQAEQVVHRMQARAREVAEHQRRAQIDTELSYALSQLNRLEERPLPGAPGPSQGQG